MPPSWSGRRWRVRIRRGSSTALPVLARLPPLRRLELQLTVDLHGRQVVVPIVDGRGPEHREITEPQLMPALRTALRARSGGFVDVGAYTGQTLVKLLIIEPRRRSPA